MVDAMIGSTFEGMIALDELDTPLEVPKFDFFDYEDTIRLEDNTDRGLGLPLARWTFPYLESAWRNQLKEFCPGASAHVFIRTKLPDDSYADYECDMIWPAKEPMRSMDLKPDFVIEFRNLESVGEAS